MVAVAKVFSGCSGRVEDMKIFFASFDGLEWKSPAAALSYIMRHAANEGRRFSNEVWLWILLRNKVDTESFLIKAACFKPAPGNPGARIFTDFVVWLRNKQPRHRSVKS